MGSLPLTIFGALDPALGADFDSVSRVQLDPCCWVDLVRGAVDGADTLFAELERSLSWVRGKRLMYGTWHDEPRLTGQQPRPGHPLPPLIDELRAALGARYERAFEGLFCNYYATGDDSVAWHADRIGRTTVEPLVAILSLGGPRTFAMRPTGGGQREAFSLASGDLLVMGGATQHHWEHAVPKVRSAPPRMSVTMRAGGPRLGAS